MFIFKNKVVSPKLKKIKKLKQSLPLHPHPHPPQTVRLSSPTEYPPPLPQKIPQSKLFFSPLFPVVVFACVRPGCCTTLNSSHPCFLPSLCLPLSAFPPFLPPPPVRYILKSSYILPTHSSPLPPPPLLPPPPPLSFDVVHAVSPHPNPPTLFFFTRLSFWLCYSTC